MGSESGGMGIACPLCYFQREVNMQENREASTNITNTSNDESGSISGERTGRRSASKSHHSRHEEGSVARAIEQQTAKVPSDAFLWAALGAAGVSLILQLCGKQKVSNFIG